MNRLAEIGQTFTYMGKCPRCKSPQSTTGTPSSVRGQVRSTCCKAWTMVKPVKSSVGTRECGEYCSTGTGMSCKCVCGGENHGLAYRVR